MPAEKKGERGKNKMGADISLYTVVLVKNYMVDLILKIILKKTREKRKNYSFKFSFIAKGVNSVLKGKKIIVNKHSNKYKIIFIF